MIIGLLKEIKTHEYRASVVPAGVEELVRRGHQVLVETQAGVGSGGTGAMAEKPELFANVLILFAIPETIVILGFVIAFLTVNSI